MKNIDIQFIKKNYKKIPISALAKKFDVTPIEITSAIRKNKINRETWSVDHDFISENLRTRALPTEKVLEILSLSHSQYVQIVNRKHNNKLRRNPDSIKTNEAITSTKGLIENVMKLHVDYDLPKKIKQKQIVEHNNPVFEWAKIQIKDHPEFKYFSPMAFLICLTYPDLFKPYQFKTMNIKNYFGGRLGKKRLVEIGRSIIAKELNIDETELNSEDNIRRVKNCFISKKHHPLKGMNLRYYGLSAKMIMCQFKNLEEYTAYILNTFNIINKDNKNSRINTKQLRNILSDKNINTDKCFYDDCDYLEKPEIHHIIPLKNNNLYRDFDFNSAENLIPLCPNHHIEFSKYHFSPNDILNKSKEDLIKIVESRD